MFGLTRDFIQSGGNYMILSSPEGIPSSAISRVQTNMISSAKVPHLLSLYLKELDFKVSIQYDITNRKMLTHLLKSDRLTMDEYYGLLLQIVGALEESTLYMLDPDQYILQEDYMFIDGPLHMGTLYMTYLPIQSMRSSEAISSSLHHLITRLMASVSELQGTGIQTLLQYVSTEDFTLTGLKGLLLNLVAGGSSSQSPVPADQHRQNNSMNQSNVLQPHSQPANRKHSNIHQSDSLSRSFPLGTNLEREIVGLSSNREDLAVHSLSRSKEREPIRQEQVIFSSDRESSWIDHYHNEELTNGNKERTSSSMTTYVAVGCLLTCAVAWRFLYLSHSGTGTLIVCIFITAFLGAMTYLVWKGKLRVPTRESESLIASVPLFESGDLESARPARKRGTSFQVERLTGFFGGSSKESEPEPSNEKWVFPNDHSIGENQAQMDWGITNREIASTSTTNRDEDKSDYYAQLGHKTELLSSPRNNATVLLNPMNNPSQDQYSKSYQSYPYLERREVGHGSQGTQGGLYSGGSAHDELASPPIVLNYPHFIIGRAADVAQFVEESPGTSRAHIEISKGSGGYVIKDLGSKNGTLLNKEAMVSYKEYPLQDGDIFTIIKGEYTYHFRS